MTASALTRFTDWATAWRGCAVGDLADQPARFIKTLTTVRMRSQLKPLAKLLSGVQMATRGDNVFIFSTPRSGSTWVMELVLSQPGFRACDQPLDIRNPYVRRHLGISEWIDLYQKDADVQLQPYLKKICDGRIRGLGIVGRHHRLVSRRLVFKIQNGWQDRVDWIRATVGGRVILLIRHPIAVTVSRTQLPRLRAFVESDYARHFSEDVIRLAEVVIESGSFLEKGVVHWCFENSVPLRAAAGTDWIVMTYEQLVTDPLPVLMELSRRLGLPELDLMTRQLYIPSRTITKSSEETRTLVAQREREPLIAKWRKVISGKEEGRAFDILRAFGVGAYECGKNMPRSEYLIGPQIDRGGVEGAGGEPL